MWKKPSGAVNAPSGTALDYTSKTDTSAGGIDNLTPSTGKVKQDAKWLLRHYHKRKAVNGLNPPGSNYPWRKPFTAVLRKPVPKAGSRDDIYGISKPSSNFPITSFDNKLTS